MKNEEKPYNKFPQHCPPFYLKKKTNTLIYFYFFLLDNLIFVLHSQPRTKFLN